MFQNYPLALNLDTYFNLSPIYHSNHGSFIIHARNKQSVHIVSFPVGHTHSHPSAATQRY